MNICRTLFLVAGFVMGLVSQSYADETGQDAWALSVGNGGYVVLRTPTESGRGAFFVGAHYFYKNNENTSSPQPSLRTQELGIVGGYRTYFKRGAYDTFLDSSLTYVYTDYRTSSRIVTAPDSRRAFASFLYGFEKPLGKSFSVEAAAGLRIGYLRDDQSKVITTELPVSRLAVNYYF